MTESEEKGQLAAGPSDTAGEESRLPEEASTPAWMVLLQIATLVGLPVLLLLLLRRFGR